MATVTLKNVRAVGLDGVLDLALADREFVVLTGPDARNGSALVRLLAGLEQVSQGEILFGDRRMNDVPPQDRDVGFLSGDYVPYPGLSVYENLAVTLRHRRFGENEIRKRIAATAEAIGLQDRLEAPPSSLSAAERRRFGLARAMVRQPAIFLFDQPFAGLAPAEASRGRADVVRLLQRSAATIIYATPDPWEALALATRTVVLVDGVVQQDADAQRIYDAPANLAVARFFGDPAMNLVHGTLKQDRPGLVFNEGGEGTIMATLPGSRFAAAEEMAGKPAVLGFRPEAIRIAETAAQPAAGRGGFRALVERAEIRGGETDLYLQTGAHDLICRARRWENPGGGRRLQFEIALEKAHLFDPGTGRRVTPEA